MDVIALSRLQFAVATIFHFLFVPLTLGLSVIIALMESRYVRTGDEEYRRMAKFWGQLFLLNFLVGVVTGITLEFQFGTNWSRYSTYVGDIFGSLLAIEATAAFFLESTLIAVWAFGWKKLSPKAHAVVIWLVAIGSTVSAFWILVANAWMQHPVGYVIRGGRAELADFCAVISQSYAVLTFLHTVMAAYILGGFFVMGISAWHLLRKQNVSFFKKSFNLALIFTLVFTVLTAVEGHRHGVDLADKQPAKLAALESHWETQSNAPMYLIAIPKLDNTGNAFEAIKVPGLLSLLAGNNTGTKVVGLNDIPLDERPPVAAVHYSFRIMVFLAVVFLLTVLWGFFKRNDIENQTGYLKILPWMIPLPYLACEFGWLVAEFGRQPWIVYGLLKTSDAASPVASVQVWGSLIAFVAVYTLIGILAFWFMARMARKGPEF